MFTGIIQGLGTIVENTDGIFKIETNLNLDNCNKGSSISCNGVCLTLIDIKKIAINIFFLLTLVKKL